MLTSERRAEIDRGLEHRGQYGTWHGCSSCDLDDEERAQHKGHNQAVTKLHPLVRELLAEIDRLADEARAEHELAEKECYTLREEIATLRERLTVAERRAVREGRA